MIKNLEDAFKNFRFELAEKDGIEGFRLFPKPGRKGKPTELEIEALRGLKPEIMAELKRRKDKKEAKIAAEKVAQEKELEELKSGQKKISLGYQDGEYLTGYTLHGQSAKLLEDLRLAKYVSGWGYLVNDSVVEALGREFTYQEAVEFARPAQEARAAKAAEKKAIIDSRFTEARETGKPVLLRKWSSDCCDPSEACSCDNHYEYAMPDGTAKHEWTHTW